MRITASSVVARLCLKLLSDLDYLDLKSSDRKQDARVSQIDW